MFFQFEIGIKKTTTYYPDCAAAAQDPRRGQEVAVVQPVLAFSAGAPKPAAVAPEGVLAPQPLLAAPPAGGSGSSIKTSAGYVSASIGIQTETPPYSGGGGGGTGQ
ncbi:MAG TPA: hypothetical protein VE075_04455 [Thermoanaerobaculia bacterium]|nr:hypothetical protein [Thermoanaerobaculia bacterium]